MTSELRVLRQIRTLLAVIAVCAILGVIGMLLSFSEKGLTIFSIIVLAIVGGVAVIAAVTWVVRQVIQQHRRDRDSQRTQQSPA